jgi:NADH dehydrogenase
MGKLLGDVIVTRDEIRGLMAGLLAVDSPPTGRTRLSDWVQARADTLGRRYMSELARRRNRQTAYGKL